jgi:hypothetical protein
LTANFILHRTSDDGGTLIKKKKSIGSKRTKSCVQLEAFGHSLLEEILDVRN